MLARLRALVFPAFSLACLAVFLLGAPVRAQERYGTERSAPERVSERDLRSFDAFLDRQWETANELYRNPELVANERFLRGHAELRAWLDDHPEAAEAIQANPRQYIWRERAEQTRRPEAERAEPPRRPASLTEDELRSFERYLDTNREVADALYKDPELINDSRFVRANPSLEDWLTDHPEAADAIQANPQKVLSRERKGTTAEDFLRELLR